MRKALICGAAALSILWACSAALTQERGRTREGNRNRQKEAGQRVSEEEKQWREKLKEMTPQERQLAMAQRAFDREIADWQMVRTIAADEKAGKTVAAIDKIIGDKKAQFDKRVKAMKARAQSEGSADGQKSRGQGRGGAKRAAKRAGQEE